MRVDTVKKSEAIRVFKSLGIEIDPHVTQENFDEAFSAARQRFPYSECNSLKDWELWEMMCLTHDSAFSSGGLTRESIGAINHRIGELAVKGGLSG